MFGNTKDSNINLIKEKKKKSYFNLELPIPPKERC